MKGVGGEVDDAGLREIRLAACKRKFMINFFRRSLFLRRGNDAVCTPRNLVKFEGAADIMIYVLLARGFKILNVVLKRD